MATTNIRTLIIHNELSIYVERLTRREKVGKYCVIKIILPDFNYYFITCNGVDLDDNEETVYTSTLGNCEHKKAQCDDDDSYSYFHYKVPALKTEIVTSDNNKLKEKLSEYNGKWSEKENMEAKLEAAEKLLKLNEGWREKAELENKKLKKLMSSPVDLKKYHKNNANGVYDFIKDNPKFD